MKNCIYYNFFPSKLKHDLVIEMICRAAHGQTEGYVDKKGEIVPVLKNSEGQKIIEHGYDDYLRGIEKFAQEYMCVVEKYDLPVRIELMIQYMDYIMTHPDSKVLDFFSDMPNSVTGREKKVVGFAPRLTKKDIRNIYLLYPNEAFERYCGTDLEYSLLRCTEIEKKRIAFYQEKRDKIADRFKRLFHKKMIEKNDRVVSFEEFPYSVFGQKIIIYGAGKFGQEIFNAVKSSSSEVVAWLDKDYKNLTEQGIPVIGNLEVIDHISYDAIIIAILNEGVVQDVRGKLLQKGILEKNIVCLLDYMKYLNV